MNLNDSIQQVQNVSCFRMFRLAVTLFFTRTEKIFQTFKTGIVFWWGEIKLRLCCHRLIFLARVPFPESRVSVHCHYAWYQYYWQLLPSYELGFWTIFFLSVS